MTQLDAGALEPRIQEGVALAPLLADCERELGPLAERRGLRLRVRASALRVRTDPALLRSVLQNLVGNALRYTDRGGVLVGARRRGREVRIEVWDTGRGISRAEQQRIFAEWRRGDDARRDGGFGLGLTIARRLCRLLGHSLELVSDPGRGTVFRIGLAGSAHAGALAERRSEPRQDFRGRVVWVIDDDREAREASGALLRAWGAGFVGLGGGSEALACAGSGPPDALFVDLRLGARESGLDVLEALRARWGHDVPACVVSGESPEALAPLRERGLLVLRKPVEPVRLRAALAHLVGSA